MSEKYTMILTNCRDDNEADYITQALFEDKLVACVQTNKVHSHYFWKGKVMHDSEIRLLIKTKKDLFQEVEAKIKGLHSYELPEIVEIPIGQGSKEFFEWVEFATK